MQNPHKISQNCSFLVVKQKIWEYLRPLISFDGQDIAEATGHEGDEQGVGHLSCKGSSRVSACQLYIYIGVYIIGVSLLSNWK